jgi:UPF0042 nucleotide-binding protein
MHNIERRSAPRPLRIIVISGLSGSGKSVALNMLEDLGFYCIDNLPANMLSPLVDDILRDERPRFDRLGIGVDARNRVRDLNALPDHVRALRERGIECELLFLQADDEILIRRYSETRRRHPLARDGNDLRDAIGDERNLLGPVINAADVIIDTTNTSVYELRDTVRERIAARAARSLSILVQSFGYKHGIPPDADFVFDLRCLPNPYWEPALRAQTGLDQAVIRFLEDQPLVMKMRDDIVEFLRRWIPQYENFHRSYLTIAIGCTGGQHRSVFMAERIARDLRSDHEHVGVRHHELSSSSSPLFS